MIDKEFKSYGDNIALIAIGIPKGRYKKDRLQWFRDIQNGKENTKIVIRI